MLDPEFAYQARVKDANEKDIRRGGRTPWIVTEAGLYRLINKAKNSPVADRFQLWICQEVLPSIRLRGEYKVSDHMHTQLQQTNKRLEEQIQRTEKRFKLMKRENDELKEINSTHTLKLSYLQEELDEAKYLVLQAKADVQQAESNMMIARIKASQARRRVIEISEEVNELEQKENKAQDCIGRLTRELKEQTQFSQEVGPTTRFLGSLYHSNRSLASNPNTNRLNCFQIRSHTLRILHDVAYYIIKGWQHIYHCPIPMEELIYATNTIMSVSANDYNELTRIERFNPIIYYSKTLTKIAKTRLTFKRYSTLMPIKHLYLYSKSLSDWCQLKLHIPSINYHTELATFFGPEKVSRFSFDGTNDADIQNEMMTNPPHAMTFL